MKKIILLNLIFLGSLYSQDYYYEKYAPFDENIKSPEEFLGYPIGEMHTRHDLIVSYMTYLSNASDKSDMFSYATSYEGRKLIYLIVSSPEKIKNIVSKMKQEISSIYPKFDSSLLWERPMAWKLVESVVKEPGKVWKYKMPDQSPGISGLFFVGDSTVSYGIGTDSAAHSAILAHPLIQQYLKSPLLTFCIVGKLV